jgi:transposase
MSLFLDLVLNAPASVAPYGPIPHPPIRRPKAPDLTRDQKRDCQLLHSIGWSYGQIRTKTGYTIDQIARACRADRPTPRKRGGRPPILTQAQVEELVEFVCASAKNRRMSFTQLAEVLEFGVKKQAIRTALLREGFHRRLAMRKPPISEKNQKLRLDWALEHVKWTMEQWYQILWTDETWITGGRHTRTWVTRRPGEEWDPTCIVEKHQRKKGWMFWGCFHGHTKGPGIFWEKDWGSINKDSYQAHTVPIIHGYIEMMRRQGVYLVLMQDGAPGHAAGDTREDLRERGIVVIFWPPFSPDLNPIERVWHIMKNYLQDNYPERMIYDALRAAVKDAWEKVGQHEFEELIKSMPDRCQAVIEANGLFTKY